MQISVKTSEANKEVVRKLTSKLPIPSAENVIARIALAYSLSSDRRFMTSEFGLYDSKGKEYKDQTLFDVRYRSFYIALICQAYGIHKLDDNIPKYAKLHLDHGLETIWDLFIKNPEYTFFDFLTDHLERGISALDLSEVSLDFVTNKNQGLQVPYFTGPIHLEIGKAVGTGEPISIVLNDTTKFSNAHIAVAGKSGTGKTQFALSLLQQITKETNEKVNFIYLDFKGLKQDDLPYYQRFFDTTKAEFIDVPKVAFPLNPLSFIDLINEKDRIMGISKFVDIIEKYANLGKRQSQALHEATRAAFAERGGLHPTLMDIFQKLNEEEREPDSLFEILDRLTELEVFAEKVKSKTSFLNRNHYFSLSGDLPASVRITSLFLVINYIYNVFMNMENAPVENNLQAMRYVLLIDEAHVLFKEKKALDLLEKILREIRSKGVSVVMLSQGIAEFNQKDFDFSSMCELAFLLDVKDKGNKKFVSRFLGIGEGDWVKVAKSLDQIQKGQAVLGSKFTNEMKIILSKYGTN
jgi:DNA sulfur modification protein DndE